jgi:hypothetical protein
MGPGPRRRRLLRGPLPRQWIHREGPFSRKALVKAGDLLSVIDARIGASAPRVRKVRPQRATLKVYPGAPHGLTDKHKEDRRPAGIPSGLTELCGRRPAGGARVLMPRGKIF